MRKKKPAKRSVVGRSRTKAKSNKTKVKLGNARKKASGPTRKEVATKMFQHLPRPKVREVPGVFQGLCELQILDVCIAPQGITIPLNNAPLKTFEFVVQRTRIRVCRACANHQDKTGAWDLERVRSV